MDNISFEKYQKIPFIEKGRNFDGCDCWGLLYLIYKDFLKIELPTYANEYENTSDEKVLGKIVNENKVTWNEIISPSIFDAVLFRIKGQPMHVGVFIGDGKFIHCLHNVGVSIEKLKSIMWRNRIIGYYHYER